MRRASMDRLFCIASLLLFCVMLFGCTQQSGKTNMSVDEQLKSPNAMLRKEALEALVRSGRSDAVQRAVEA